MNVICTVLEGDTEGGTLHSFYTFQSSDFESTTHLSQEYYELFVAIKYRFKFITQL